jgi:flagellar biosynthesis/type III secretory pathway protein FliH
LHRSKKFSEGEAKGRAEGKAEGRAEGKAEGRAEGKAEGKAEGEANGEAKVFMRLALIAFRKVISDNDLENVIARLKEDGYPLDIIHKAKSQVEAERDK